jgi:hypothetical protein
MEVDDHVVARTGAELRGFGYPASPSLAALPVTGSIGELRVVGGVLLSYNGTRWTPLNTELDVSAFGAVGNGIVDDTIAIQSAVTAVGAGALKFPAGKTYRISAPITASTAGAIFYGGAVLNQVDALLSALSIRASGVTVNGLRFTGPGNTAAVFGWDRNAIDAVGTLALPLTDINIQNVRATGFSGNGVLFEWVDRFSATGFHVESIKYAGIACLQSHNGHVNTGRIIGNTIGLPGNENAYGVFLSMRGNTGDWRTENVLVDNVHVSDFPTWEGLDTHGGKKITFSNCLIERCKRGIAVIRAPQLDGSRLAPLDCSVIGNTMDSGTDDALARFEGINFSGALTGVTVDEYATGRIVGNTIRRYGLDEANRQSGAITMFAAKGVAIADNNMIECSTNGIALTVNTEGVAITGNTFIDPHATVGASASCIRAISGPINGTVVGNTYQRGTLTGPTHIGDFGVHVPSPGTNVSLQYSANDFQLAGVTQINDVTNRLIGPAASVTLSQISPPRTDQLYSLTATPGGGSGPLDLVSVAATDLYGVFRWIELANPPNERITFALSANQSIPSGVWTEVSWTSIVFQFELPVAATVPTPSFTIPFGGQWHVEAAGNFGAGSVGERGIRIKNSGAVLDDFMQAPINTANRATPRLSRDWSFSTGAVITVEVWQDSGADAPLATRSVFCVRRIGLV